MIVGIRHLVGTITLEPGDHVRYSTSQRYIHGITITRKAAERLHVDQLDEFVAEGNGRDCVWVVWAGDQSNCPADWMPITRLELYLEYTGRWHTPTNYKEVS